MSGFGSDEVKEPSNATVILELVLFIRRQGPFAICLEKLLHSSSIARI